MGACHDQRYDWTGDLRVYIPLAPHCNYSPIVALLISLLLNLRRERNCTHDTVAKLLVQHRLVRVPIVLHNLVESVDQRLNRGHWTSTSTVWKPEELLGEQCMVGSEDLGELLDVLWGCLRLPVEESRDGNFGATELLRDGFKCETLACLGIEEGLRGGWETVDEGGLQKMVVR